MLPLRPHATRYLARHQQLSTAGCLRSCARPTTLVRTRAVSEDLSQCLSIGRLNAEGRQEEGPAGLKEKKETGGPEQGNGGPSPPSLPPKAAYLISLLVQSCGFYGTVAVIVGAIFHISPFGGLSLNQSDMLLGIAFFAPVILLDAAIMIPDHSDSSSKGTSSLFLDESIKSSLAAMQKAGFKVAPDQGTGTAASPTTEISKGVSEAQEAGAAPASSTTTATTTAPTASSSTTDPTDPTSSTAPTTAPSSTSSADADAAIRELETLSTVSIFSRGGGQEGDLGESGVSIFGKAASDEKVPELTGVALATRRVTLAFEILQGYYVRDNPTIIFSPVTECGIILATCLAEEMYYRAIGLTFVSRWLCDRLYEAGADDVIMFMGHDVAPIELTKWATAIGGVTLGGLFYAANTWQEMSTMNKMVKAVAEGQVTRDKQEDRRSTLNRLAPPKPNRSPQAQGPSKAAALSQMPPELTRKLAEKFGSQHVVVSVIQGVREMLVVGVASASFILTSNLAAPLAGSIVMQSLFSTYQRRAAHRSMMKKQVAIKEFVERRNKLLVQKIKNQLPPDADE